ncbi:MAG: Dna2/Cas4 domain-containing protein [Methanobrevibacter sp.]|nr:Dna2/Cas4 domain-containing protein [Methanobrevibacter sp.]
MISISTIRTYMFCPLKLYLEQNLDEDKQKDILLNKTMKELRIDLQDLFQRNIRRLRKEMELEEIESNLNTNIINYIESSIAILENSDFEYNEAILGEKTNNNEADEIELLKKELIEEANFNMKILALKSQKAMINNERDGTQIAELFFPTSMYSYLMRDPQIELVGSCDKIEIIEGKYYPINIKPSIPPLKGTWDSDAMELVASALLIEQEFDTEVFVGFVDYLKLGDRRPVVMDANLRKGLFKVMNEIKDIVNEKIVPDINVTIQKCVKCEYNKICHKDEDLE